MQDAKKNIAYYVSNKAQNVVKYILSRAPCVYLPKVFNRVSRVFLEKMKKTNSAIKSYDFVFTTKGVKFFPDGKLWSGFHLSKNPFF